MAVKEKLVELLDDMQRSGTGYFGSAIENKKIADYLITHGVTMQEWIQVDEMLLEEKVNCIVYYKHAYCDNDDYWAIGICFYDGEKFQMDWSYKVTHWMPLPKPPKGE